MTPAQKRLRELEERRSKERGRMSEIALLDDSEMTPEIRSELDAIEKGTSDLEARIRAAQVAVDDEDDQAEERAKNTPSADPEMRERIELRSRVSVGRYLTAALRGRALTGAEAELFDAAKLPDDAPEGAIPVEAWEVPVERRNAEDREITAAPGTVGINLDPLRPMVFAPSVAKRLMVHMPAVSGGTFATGTITTAATAGAVAKSAEVPETAAAFTVQTTIAHRVGASLNLTAEDIASVGAANFEPLLRQQISLVLASEVDDQLLNGAAADNDLTGIIKRLEDIANPIDPTDVATFDAFVAAYADSIDGLWGTSMKQISMIAGVATYQLASKTFRDISTADLGSISFADYAEAHTAGFSTNKRMPAAASNIQRAIVCRKGRSMDPAPMRTAVCPHWGYISVDDIYSGARKAERRFVISVLLGDLILVQPDAYTLREFKVA